MITQEKITNEMIDTVYQALKDRRIHPEGEFDKKGRWYPSDDENSDNYTNNLRSPSNNWPYSYLLGARTKKHVKSLAEINPEFFIIKYKSVI